MKAIFYVLALLVTIGAAYFSWDNKGKFEVQKDQKIAAIDQNKVVTRNANNKDEALQQELAALDTANKDKAEVEASIDTLKGEETTARRSLTEVESTLEEQKATFTKLEESRRQVDEILQGAGVTLEELPNEVVKIQDDKKAKEKQLGELESLVEAASKTVESNQAEIGRLADRTASRNARIRRNAMESVVTAVNEDWGFIVIGAGRNTGFTPQTKLLVKRDGRLIAEVKPSAIEPSQTIAEIDLESVAPGARIQPGDRVILANPATN